MERERKESEKFEKLSEKLEQIVLREFVHWEFFPKRHVIAQLIHFILKVINGKKTI